MKFGFIAKHRGIWPVLWMCEALGVLRGGFYAVGDTAPQPAAAGTTRRTWCQGAGAASLACREPAHVGEAKTLYQPRS